MPTKDLKQVVAYIKPALKKLAESKVRASDIPMTMSGYIATLIRRDLEKKGA